MFADLPLPSIGHFDFMIDVEVKVRASTIRAMRSSQSFGEALNVARSEFDALLNESRRRTTLLKQLLRRVQGG